MGLRLSSSVAFGASFVLAFAVTDLRDAEACGGCFHPPPKQIETGSESVSSVVTDHRMVFKVSANESILWDQVRYTGAPEEFAWVLPVHEGATIELSHDELIASLDAVTKSTVKGPQRTCYPAGGGAPVNYGGNDDSGGCGGDDDNVSFASDNGARSAGGAVEDAGAETDNVDVVSQAVIGPYQSVTLHAKNGEGIGDWLTKNDYVIPDNVKPTIDAYTKEGFDFIALRLRPGQGVQAMRPVRVVSPGGGVAMPLRMVAAGIGAKVGLTLWVIGEGRYDVANFTTSQINDADLRWDAKVGRSNLTTLEESALGTGAWVAQVSAPQQLDSGGFSFSTKSLYSKYMQTCIANAPQTKPCDENELPSADAGADAGTGQCTKLVTGCDGYDDLEVASRGLHSSDVWVTRLRAELPVSALSQDLQLGASAEQTSYDGTHTANTYADPNDDPCPNGVLKSTATPPANNATPPPADDSGCTCRTTPMKKSTGTWLLIGVTAFVAARVARRRRYSGRR